MIGNPLAERERAGSLGLISGLEIAACIVRSKVPPKYNKEALKAISGVLATLENPNPAEGE